ncbi:MAG: thioredoxin-like domain-containing protein [Fimbriimonadales bacterium]|nr:thioredoxin-like domain-containing protein [Fimbriimonadales bacterium]
MRLLGIFWGTVTTLCVFWGQVAPDTPLITLRIVDPDGRPVPQARVCAEAVVQGDDTINLLTSPAWQRVSPRGLCVIDGSFEHRMIADALTRGERTMKFTALVQAPGYRPVMLTHEGKLPREATVTLQPARTLELRLTDWENRPVELQHNRRYLVPRAEESPVQIAHERNEPLYDVRDLKGNPARPPQFEDPPLFLEFGIERTAEGTYRVALPSAVQGSVYVIVNAPGVIRGYLRPISPQELEAGVVEVRLPKPARASFTVDFQTPEAREATRASVNLYPMSAPQNFQFQNLWMGHTRMLGETPNVSPRQPQLVIADLAPGAWQVSAWLTKGDWDNVDTVRARLDAPEGDAVQLTLKPEPFDPKRYQGNRTVTLKVRRAGGKPFANAPYRIELNLWRRGKRATIAQGKLDANGAVRLINLYELPKDAENEMNYLVFINGQQLGMLTLRAGDGQRELTLTLPPRQGEPAPNITVVDLKTGKPLSLQALRGKWVYLEFWATWCGPCQAAMQALKEATDKHGARWRGKLEILTVSIDDERGVVMPHLQQRGWDKFARHAWDAEQKAANAYGVQAIPNAFLIDPAGKVVWLGNPLAEEPGAKLNRYLQTGGKR